LSFIFSNGFSLSPCLYFFSCVIHSFCCLFSSLWVLLLHKFEIFAHCADFASWDFCVLHKLGDFKNVLFFFLPVV
jgi:hypothetical protein